VPTAVLVLGALAPRLAPGLRPEPGAWLAIATCLSLATLVAVLGPARRASRVDPARILRDA
jgi:ABC-type lipoprotein release transport system permease subunit